MLKMSAENSKLPAAYPRKRIRNRTAFVNTWLDDKSNTFLNDISGIILILKLTGLLPMYQKITRYELSPPKRTARIYYFINHALVHAITIYNMYSLFSENSTQLFYSYSDTDNVNYWIEILLCITTYTTTVLTCFFNSKSFLKILNGILKVDKEISEKCSADIDNECGFAIKYIILIVVLQWYITILKVLGIEGPLTVPSYILIVFYSMQNGLSLIFIVYASTLLRLVTVRFAYLNTIINCYSYREQQGTVAQSIRQSSVGNFSQPSAMNNFPDDSLFVFRIYNKLLCLYKSINESCSVILVIYMGYTFYSVTTTTYNLFIHITAQHSNISPIVLQLCFALLFLQTAMLLLLSRCCGQATNQANALAPILAQVYGRSKQYKNIINKFLIKSIKQDISFSAYGFFLIDESTLFKIFSAVTTYLVILVQFKQLEESKMEDYRSKEVGITKTNATNLLT